MTVGPRLTVGVPVRNGANFIRPAIDSLLAQTYRDFAILVSDNASTDGTVAIVEEYMGRHPNIRMQRHPANIGAHRNYNSLVTGSTGELFKWMAHDDVIAPTFLAACVARLDADPGASLAFANSGQIDEEGRITGDLASTESYVDPSPYRGCARTWPTGPRSRRCSGSCAAPCWRLPRCWAATPSRTQC